MTNTEKKLLAQIEKLSHDSIWNCYTRAALDLRWSEFTKNAKAVVYCDIDKMHDLNEKFGHNGTDKRIKKIINNVRVSDIVASRYLNGDEIIFILKTGNAHDFCIRILRDMKAAGISATFSHTTNIKKSALSTINPIDKKVQNSKNAGVRGVILE